MNNWDCVDRELQRWSDGLPPARLWLRDDDAIDVTRPFEQLATLTEQFDVPVTIAVIPDFARHVLAEKVLQIPHVCVALHGHAHNNHAPDGEKKCELGLHRGKQVVLDELVAGRLRLEQMFGRQFINMLVPPWNRIARQLVPELTAIGLSTLSSYGWNKIPAPANLVQLNTHVDIIDWRGTRGGRPVSVLASEVANALAVAREKGGEPVGILAHHLVHDATAWAFLQELFTFTKGRDDIHWCQAASLSGVSIG